MMTVRCANREDAVRIYRFLQTLTIHSVGPHNVTRVTDRGFNVDAPDYVVPQMIREVNAKFQDEVKK